MKAASASSNANVDYTEACHNNADNGDGIHNGHPLTSLQGSLREETFGSSDDNNSSQDDTDEEDDETFLIEMKGKNESKDSKEDCNKDKYNNEGSIYRPVKADNGNSSNKDYNIVNDVTVNNVTDSDTSKDNVNEKHKNMWDTGRTTAIRTENANQITYTVAINGDNNSRDNHNTHEKKNDLEPKIIRDEGEYSRSMTNNAIRMSNKEGADIHTYKEKNNRHRKCINDGSNKEQNHKLPIA